MAVAAVAVTGLSSCDDFLTIYPTDKTIGEDFWKTKEDVDNMVTGAYSNMLSSEIQRRAIIWGAYRSDELVKNSSFSSTDLDNISAVNLLPTNGYNSWASFYSVINRCNIVLSHAEAVMEEDPQFTLGDYNTARGQMLSLRSLCYFYLVRAFRDVPYTTQSYETDDVNMIIAQTSPDSVLQHCIDDLEEASKYVLKTGAYGSGNWRNKGYFTRDAVNALLADIYLWRASMTKSASDYEKCIEYCDKVIEAKDLYYRENHNMAASGDKSDIYHLTSGSIAFSTIFGSSYGNAEESILEWQYDGTANSNIGLENLYYMTGSSKDHKSYGEVMASSVFNVVDENASNSNGRKMYQSKNDRRFWDNVYEVGSEEASELYVRKMIDTDGYLQGTAVPTKGMDRSTSRAFDYFRQNWIVYRLTDVMLMKAEAQVQLAVDDDDIRLRQAFNLVQAVNNRSLYSGNLASDSLKFNYYKTRVDLEPLVMTERLRELCFEGKRWYDLMRYNFRHVEGIDYGKTLYQQQEEGKEFTRNDATFLNLVTRKYTSGAAAAASKMRTEPYLYMPVNQGDIDVNMNLRQNPAYRNDSEYEKNY